MNAALAPITLPASVAWGNGSPPTEAGREHDDQDPDRCCCIWYSAKTVTPRKKKGDQQGRAFLHTGASFTAFSTLSQSKQ